MAFYNRKMAQNKSLTKAWRAAHLGKLDVDKEICLPEICDEIARWMRRDRHPRSRLSLRSFSVLLSGTCRLYSRQLGHLLKDTFECSLFTSVTPKPIQSTVGQGKLRSECSEEESSELMPELEETDTTTSTNENPSESTEYFPDDTKSPSTDENDEMSEESTVFTVTPNSDQQPNISAEASVEKRDQQSQTSPIPVSDNIGGFDPNLPFGYLIVHDNYHSRIPSKILFTSWSENVKFPPIRKPMN